MKNILLFTPLMLLLIACTRKRFTCDGSMVVKPFQETEWVCGHSVEMEYKEWYMESKKELIFLIDRGSLCSNSAIEVIISINGKESRDTIIDPKWYRSFVVPQDDIFAIQTNVITVNKKVCKWLGQAKCTVLFE